MADDGYNIFYSQSNKNIVFQEKELLYKFGYITPILTYKCMTKDTNDRCIVYYEKTERNILTKDDWEIWIHIDEFANKIHKVFKHSEGCTVESIKRAYRDMPIIRDYILTDCFREEIIWFEYDRFFLNYFGAGRDFPFENSLDKLAHLLADFADTCIREITNEIVYKNDLVLSKE